MWLNWEKYLHKSNKYIVTYFHGKPEDSVLAKQQVDHFLNSSESIEYIVTAASLIESRLVDWGIPKNKIIKIPLGVDTQIFSPVSFEKKINIRKRIGIPNNYLVIGSFQKDGIGWGEGKEPKLIKGPDIFIKTIKKLRNHFNLFILLTGPARGYVKRELDKMNIPYLHKHVDSYLELTDYYRALDVYLVASREEGGPKAILESIASGIPIVTTNVGMAADIITDGTDGYIAPIEDYKKLSDILGELLSSSKKRKNISLNALKIINKYDWQNIAEEYYKKLYLPLIK